MGKLKGFEELIGFDGGRNCRHPIWGWVLGRRVESIKRETKECRSIKRVSKQINNQLITIKLGKSKGRK